MAQLHLKQWMLGAGGALLLSGSAFAYPQAPETAPTPPSQPSQPSSTAMQHQGEPVPNQAKSKDIADLKKQAKAFQDDWNAQDSKALSKLFTNDAALLTPSGDSAVGQQQIEQQFVKELQSPEMKGSQMSLQVETVRQLSPDLLLADTIHTMTNPNAPQGKPTEVHAVVVAQKQGNQWLFREVRAINEMPMQQMGVGGSGETQPPAGQNTGGSGETQPPAEQNTGGSSQPPPEQQPLEPGQQPDTGGSGMEQQRQPPPDLERDTGGSGLEPTKPKEPSQPPDTSGSQSQPSQPTY